MIMNTFLHNFGISMVELNDQLPGHQNGENTYQPGIGPYGEDQIVDLVMDKLLQSGGINESFIIRPSAAQKKELGLSEYKGLTGRSATPDLVLGNKLIEFKIARPLRDNGQLEDTWFKKVFDPHPTSYSTFIDVEKLTRFGDVYDYNENFEKWIVVIGFERHQEDVYQLDKLFPGLFTFISENIVGRTVKDQISMSFQLSETHPFHQVVKLFSYRF